MALRDERLLILDGACGSNIQRMNLPPDAWGERCAGCNDYLNLSRPEAIVALHRSFLDAGAMILETNTFGANPIVLREYGLAGETERINAEAVAHARRAIGGAPRRYVAGSVGPTTKLPSLGHIEPDALAEAYDLQIRALVEAGVDALIIETCQDLLQAKTALRTALAVLEARGLDLPILVSVTVEPTGTLLVGSSIAAVAAALRPFPIFSLGLNCATGPAEMEPHVAYLARHWPGRISAVPNAGIPEVVDGRTRYPLAPEDLAAFARRFVERYGVSIVGGCCGTTPDHIAALAAALADAVPAARRPEVRPSLASPFGAVEIAQEIPPLLVGERMNANGSKKLRELLLADDFDAAVAVGVEQEGRGAHVLDLQVAYAGRNEKRDMTAMVTRLRGSVRAPLAIDSTSPEAIDAALAAYPGRALVNSVNLEDGGATLDRVLRLVKRHGAAVVALAIGPKGMAKTVADKLAVAREIHRRATAEHGLAPADLFFDMLTFTIGSGDADLDRAAAETIAAISALKAELPGVYTILGVSNVSFGLPRRARPVLNSVFLHEAIAAGLDAAIVDAGNILPLATIPKVERDLSLDLIYDRRVEGEPPPLERFLAHFAAGAEDAGEEASSARVEAAEIALERKLVRGDREDLDDLLAVLLVRRSAQAIINDLLVPAMRRIGELFGRGEMLLPFVLKSAEVMKRCVDSLAPHMGKVAAAERRKILLATVQGDVHDIGKNLVEIILGNNGYDVVNIGINVPAARIAEEARHHRVDAIGLSGLLVKSAIVMQESMPIYQAAGLDVPILLGGAALTRKFVAKECVPAYRAPVVYCADAFAGLEAMQALERGALRPTTHEAAGDGGGPRPGSRQAPIARDVPTPKPPFLGARRAADIDAALLLPFVNKQALFRGRWGFRRAKTGAEEHAALLASTVEPLWERLTTRVLAERLARPAVAWGYFRCRADQDALIVEDGARGVRFDFPRQTFAPHLCIADYFKTAAEGGDVVGLFVATLGAPIVDEARRLHQAGELHDYAMLHGLAAELTDALAEHWHAVMRDELGFPAPGPADAADRARQPCRGSRFAFGYPACPDLGAQRLVFDLVGAEAIGVSLTETMEMVPEVSTSAIVVHHPAAKYFAV